MAVPDISFKIKFASSDPDVTVVVPAAGTFESVIQQIKLVREWPGSKHVRLLCAGRELYPDDPLTKAPAKTLHCMATDAIHRVSPPVRKPCPPPAPATEQPPVDWLDVVDPGVVLMWIFGSILALLWLLFIFYAHMFDRTSIVMLCMMTVAFLIPCILSYMPWPAFLHTHPRPASASLVEAFDPATGRSTTMAQQPWSRQSHGPGIPPRPHARVRVGS